MEACDAEAHTWEGIQPWSRWKIGIFFHPTKETSRRMLWIQLEREREEKLRALGETLSIGVEAKAASGQVLTSSAIPIVQSQPYYGTTANIIHYFF